MTEIDTSNRQLVGAMGDKIIVQRPQTTMTKAEALLFAAWLVALAEDESGQFAKVLSAVTNL